MGLVAYFFPRMLLVAALLNHSQIALILQHEQIQLSSLKAVAMMYYILAAQDPTMHKIHKGILALANITWSNCDGYVQHMLGGAWSPFSQRRLLCNFNSVPHVDTTNDRYTLNSLTFLGTAHLWLLVVIEDITYAFETKPGASILLLASLFVYFTAGWVAGDRFVLTNWTSNQLGYRGIIEHAP